MHGLVVVVGTQCHVGEDVVAMVFQPAHRLGVSFSASTERHQFGMTLVNQPFASLVVETQGMDEQAQLRVTVPQKPIA